MTGSWIINTGTDEDHTVFNKKKQISTDKIILINNVNKLPAKISLSLIQIRNCSSHSELLYINTESITIVAAIKNASLCVQTKYESVSQ